MRLNYVSNRSCFTIIKTMSYLKIYFAIFLILLLSGFSYGNNVTDNVCECVNHSLCVDVTDRNGDGGIIDIRIQTRECPNFLEICCEPEFIIPSTSTTGLPKNGCGYRNVKGIGQKTEEKGNESQFGEFPWMIAVFHKAPNETKHFYKCGGSLIHSQVALTAAHCIPKEGTLKIRAGEWDRTIIQKIYKHQDRNVTSYIIHKDFDKINLQNDIALLFLNFPVDINTHINVICLPPQSVLESSGKCFVTGWGKKKFEENEGEQTVLKKIQVPLINKSQCQNDFRKTRLKRKFHLHRSFICAGGEEGKDACTGDEGGPLVCQISKEKEQYQQVGIVSWGIGCGTKRVPRAYADVAHLRSWIDEMMNTKNFSLGDY